jgi:hypothetical protein
VVVKPKSGAARFAERTVRGIDDGGAPETVVIWIERRPGAVWAVGRSVNPATRPGAHERRADFLFEGYELDDALECANSTLEDDVVVSEGDGRSERVRPFTRDELLKPLERWFFGHR